MMRSERAPDAQIRRTNQSEERAGPAAAAEVAPTPATESPQERYSDEQLMEAFLKRNDQEAFGELVRRIEPWLLMDARRLLSNRTDAQDLVQDVLVKLYEGHGYDPTRSLKTWLKRLLRNAAIDVIRKRRTRHPVNIDVLLELADDGDPELIAELAEAMAKLPEDVRAAFEQHLEGYTSAEIALKTGCGTTTAHRRVQAAKDHLRVVLNSYGGSGTPS